MKDNATLLESLMLTKTIDIQKGPIFGEDPAPLPFPFDYGRIKGMMLGLAIGDAMGNTSEAMSPEQRKARYGEIRGYLPNRHAQGRPVGLSSDDSQLAFWSLEQMIVDQGMDPAHIADRFTRHPIYGMGATVREFLHHYHSGQPWHQCGPQSAGNGAVMRIAPVVIPHLKEPSPLLWADTALLAMLTHNDAAAIASCIGFTAILWDLLHMIAPPEPIWYLRRFMDAVEGLEMDLRYHSRAPGQEGFQGTLQEYVIQSIITAWSRRLSVVEACHIWYSGAYLLETMPSVLYILMQAGHDPEEAIIRAVNDTWDNDTIAAMVGAAVGALHGMQSLPKRWLDGLVGTTGSDAPGTMCRTLDEAEQVFVL